MFIQSQTFVKIWRFCKNMNGALSLEENDSVILIDWIWTGTNPSGFTARFFWWAENIRYQKSQLWHFFQKFETFLPKTLRTHQESIVIFSSDKSSTKKYLRPKLFMWFPNDLLAPITIRTSQVVPYMEYVETVPTLLIKSMLLRNCSFFKTGNLFFGISSIDLWTPEKEKGKHLCTLRVLKTGYKVRFQKYYFSFSRKSLKYFW